MNPLIPSILGAIIYALGGYFKSSTVEDFDRQKFITTILVGAIVGIIQFYLQVDIEAAYAIVLGMGLVSFIENVAKATIRWLEKRGGIRAVFGELLDRLGI